MKRLKKSALQDHTKELFLTPTLVFMGIFVVYPIIYSAILAMSQITFPQGVLTTSFNGLSNFIKVIKNKLFVQALKNTIIFTFIRITGTFIIGLMVALVVSRAKGLLAKILKTLFLLPWALSDVVNGMMWQWMYNSQYGIINEILLRLGIINNYIPWLNTPATALYAIIFADIWKSVPFVALMYLAALKNVSQDLYDASEVDGANIIQRFLHITIPTIKPIIMITTIIQTMWALKSFDLIWVLTEGGPLNSTLTLAVLAYRESFIYMRLGTGAAMAYLLTFLSILFIYIYLKSNRKDKIDD
ncbi:Lactose transport system permease protein LacF [bioreactor metagenome]|uniref:Lactose transport system permease protein LacF n=1 Tax=bioreactor metagenome TaxID=1076179 RepID=A0A645BZY9_9ZZZZ